MCPLKKHKKNEVNLPRYVYHLLCFMVLLVAMSSCKLTKFVPEGKYLLYKTRIILEDSAYTDVYSNDLAPYLSQTHNSEILGFWKLALSIYNTSPLDTTKRSSRIARKLGQAPVIYDEGLTAVSMSQITKAMQNKGYFDATVDTSMFIKDRKMFLTYHVTANESYRIKNYDIYTFQKSLYRLAHKDSEIDSDMVFSSEILDKERARVALEMRNKGYYFFEKNLLRFEVDSTIGDYNVNVNMHLKGDVANPQSENHRKVFTQYYIQDIYFFTDFNPKYKDEDLIIDSVVRGSYHFYWTGKKLLREKFLLDRCMFVPGALYSEDRVSWTYARLSSLSAVKYVNITFEKVGRNKLNCYIILNRSKLNNIMGEVEGTYSAGDWGVLTGIGYTNRNVFKGSEQITLSAKGSYEWRGTGGNAIESEGKIDLRLPSSFDISVLQKYQSRPGEFSRFISNLSLGYTIRQRAYYMTHQFNFLDLSFVYLPTISDAFKDLFLQPTNILKYSYEDHLILGWNYTFLYNSYTRPNRSFGTVRFLVETSGNALFWLSKIMKPDNNSKMMGLDDGIYTIWTVPYSQYAKGELDLTYNTVFNEKHRLVYRLGVGVAYPYGNAHAVPFEKRYFAGGANSVRGWTARTLGPGAYKRTGKRIEYNNQAGDVRLDMNLEYRWRVWKFINIGAFMDAGNIWTIRDYESQPNGQFKFDSFYEQLAWSYGAGLRLDFNIVVLRLDLGVKLHDPSRKDENKQWRTIPNGLGWSDDMSFHIAIGYPF